MNPLTLTVRPEPFDKPVLSYVEGLTTNGTYRRHCTREQGLTSLNPLWFFSRYCEASSPHYS